MIIDGEEKKTSPFWLLVVQIMGAVVLVIVLIGIIQGWNKIIQFSNAFFWAAVIAAGCALGSSMAFSGAILHSLYHGHDRGLTIMETLRSDHDKTRPTRRFALQLLIVAVICLGFSVIISFL